MDKIIVLIATHKKYVFPTDSMYLPIQVGTSKNIGIQRDNNKENISEKNAKFSELTALYWGWKNLDYEYLGLVHYRRLFRNENSKIGWKFKNKTSCPLTYETAMKIFNSGIDVILPKKRNYYIDSLYSHYVNTLYEEPLLITEKIIQEKFPEYYQNFLKLKTKKSGYMYNMFIMKKEILNKYLDWLFEILFVLENKTSHLKYDQFHNRFIGRISELLLNVWLEKNKPIHKEVSILETEKKYYFKKIIHFLTAKFLKKKYKKSF